jgi:hypothetical protein
MQEKETKQCQNCHKDFTIEPDDFAFYEKMKVPPPTFCPECRVVRRMAFRNERTLYKKKVSGSEKEIVSIFSPDNKQNVYDHATWWGDSWDSSSYAKDVDFSRPFLQQVKELWQKVPDVALFNINPINSEYCSITEGNKNCYLVFGGDFNENTSYSTYAFHSKECLDTFWVSKSEYNYETVDCISCTRLSFGRYCQNSYNSSFLFNCRNCHDCFGCVNLTNKSYQIFNEQYTKEEYLEKIKEFDLSKYSVIQEIKARFKDHVLGFPCRYANIIHSVKSTGDNLENTKNCRECFDVFGGAEDCVHLWLAYSKAKDIYDSDRVGLGAELCVDCSTVYPGSRIFYSRFIFNSHDVSYSYNNHNSSYLFGCVGMRDKQYCILNKKYTKEEYEVLVSKIIQHMNDMPYVDAKGRTYKYGEFFPPELSPFAYNETVAQEILPLSKEDAINKGYTWKDAEKKNYTVTLKHQDIPDSIVDVKESILSEVIECEHGGRCNHQCAGAFKLTASELKFYKAMNIAISHLCPSCRHYGRVEQRNPMKLWHRKCMKEGCNNEFETSYAPDRPEIVYCEQCYQQEVV